MLITFCAIGILCLLLLVLLPAGVQEGFTPLRKDGPVIAFVAITTTLLLLTLGTLYQWFVFIAGRNGKTVFVSCVAILILPPHLLGEYYQNEFLLGLTPTAHIANWLSGSRLAHVEYMLAGYAALLLGSWLSLRRRMGHLERVIDRKLQTMGVAKPAS
jgi:hypothetical protein